MKDRFWHSYRYHNKNELFVALIYTAVLGVLFEHSFSIVPPRASGKPIRVVLHVNGTNCIFFFSTIFLFVTDWISFHYFFSPKAQASFDLLESWVVIPYLPGVVLLGLAAIFSYDRSGPGQPIHPLFFCLLGFYHLLALGGDLGWVTIKLLQSPAAQQGLSIELVACLGLYLVTRGTLCGIYLHYWSSHTRTVLLPVLLCVPGFFLKPLFMLVLYRLDVFGLLQ